MATPTKVTGHGGFIVRGAVAGGITPYDAAVRFDVGKWELDLEAVAPPVTESDSQGWEELLVGLYRVNSVMISLVQKLEAAAIFELSCCPVGGKVDLYLRKGGTSFADLVTQTIFTGLRKSNDNASGDPLREDATFKSGRVTWNVAIPAYVLPIP